MNKTHNIFDKPCNQRFGSISFWLGSGSGSWDPHLGKVDPDPDPRIHLSVIVDPDLNPRIHIWKKWIRIRVLIFHIFNKDIHVGQIKMLIFIRIQIRIRIRNAVYKFSLFEVQCVSKYFIKSLLHLIPVSVSIKKSLLLYKVIWSMWSCKACTIESAVLMQPWTAKSAHGGLLAFAEC